MRIIKFRGKRIDNNKWIYGYYFYKWRTKQHVIHLSLLSGVLVDKEFEVIPKTVGELIGLQDSEGKDIYEGDIVRFELENKSKDETITHDFKEVYWDSELLEFGLRYDFKLLHKQFENEFEVIGNVHENPELR